MAESVRGRLLLRRNEQRIKCNEFIWVEGLRRCWFTVVYIDGRVKGSLPGTERNMTTLLHQYRSGIATAQKHKHLFFTDEVWFTHSGISVYCHE